MKTLEVQNITISINCPPRMVYEFISNPMNLPKWASGLSDSIQYVNRDWFATSPMGRIKIKFADKNPFGVVDHDVTLESGAVFHNPMRVLPNNDGSEVMFTLFRQADMSDDKFADDARWVKKDLERLKSVLEL